MGVQAKGRRKPASAFNFLFHFSTFPVCYDPPAFRGVVDFCALPRVCPPAWPFEPPPCSLFAPPLRPRAADRSRSPTLLVLSAAADSFSVLRSSADFGLYSLPTSSTCATSAESPRRNPTRRIRV